MGNLGAHYDGIRTVEPVVAKELLPFLRELLRYLYEPSDLKRRRGGKDSIPTQRH